MEIKINPKDLLWSYGGHIFSLASGILTLPPILRHLSPDEIGLNYLFQTILAIAVLFDFGFSPQFGRNITYVLGGAQKLQKEGLNLDRDGSNEINLKLLKTLILAGKRVYAIIASISFIFMLTFGTAYLYKVTGGFTLVKHSIWIWLSLLTVVSFNIYYNYYNPLLLGKGLIKQNNQILVFTKTIYIGLIFLLIKLDFGLFSLVIGNFITIVLSRYFANRIFFTKALKSKLYNIKVNTAEIKEVFHTIWHNASKLGIILIGGFLITKSGLFLGGLYLSLGEVASYGLTSQLFTIIATFSTLMFSTYQPRFGYLLVNSKRKEFINEFALSTVVFYFVYLIGTLCLLFIGGFILTNVIKSDTILLGKNLILLYGIVQFLEINHSNFAVIISTGNKIPFVKAGLFSGIFVLLLIYISLSIFQLGLLGIIVSQGIVQLLYNNWKWPKVVLDDFCLGYIDFIKIGLHQIFLKILLKKSFI